MALFFKLFLLTLTLTGPFFIIYGAYILTYGKKQHRVRGIALIVGGILAGALAYIFNSLLLPFIF